MSDPFENHVPGLNDPATHAAIVTPSDSSPLETTARALIIGAGGDLKVTTKGGETLVIPNVPAGILPLSVAQVHETDTTATDITALW